MARKYRGSGRSTLQLHLPDRWPDLGAASEPRLRWARREELEIDFGESNLREIRPAEETIVVVPVSRVLFARVRMPAGSTRKLDKVLPYLVEEQIVSAPEEIVVIPVDRRAPDEDSLVAVVERAWLQQAAGELEVQGFKPSRVIVESELLDEEYDPITWTLVRTPAGGFLSFGQCEAIVLDTMRGDTSGTTLPLGLQLAMEERKAKGGGPWHINVLTAPGMVPPPVEQWSRLLDVPVADAGTWEPERIDARERRRTDLLVASRGSTMEGMDWLARYRLPVAIAAGIVVVHGLITIGDWVRLKQEAASLRSEMFTRYQGIYPDAKTIVDPALQLSRGLADLRRAAGQPQPGDFIPLLAKVAPRLAAAGLKPQKLRYENGQLSLDVPVGSGETRESLVAKLATDGVRVQVEAVGASSATVRLSAEGA